MGDFEQRTLSPHEPRLARIVALAFGGAFVLMLLAIAGTSPQVDYRSFFGDANPYILSAAILILGAAAMEILHTRFGFLIWRKASVSRFIVAALTVAPFAVFVTILDLLWRYPEDLNVSPPAAFAFYPAIGVVAQISLHIAPLLLLLTIMRTLPMRISEQAQIFIAIGLASFPEAFFQIRHAGFSFPGLSILNVLTFANLLAFGFVELSLYKRFDFATMFTFRMSYYLYWHIMWGTLRLSL